MAKADCVLSTPPTNTSAIGEGVVMTIERPMFPPVDPARRRIPVGSSFLKIVAGTTAATSEREEADREFFRQHDPALRAINAHRQAAKIHTEAVSVEFASEGKVTKAAYARLQETTSEAWDDMVSAARGLVKTPPITMLGAIALLQYLATVFDDEGSGVDCSTMPETVDDEPWPAVFFRTLAASLVQVQP